MPNPRLIDAAHRSSPADSKTPRGHPRPIPVDLLKDASRRLGVVALIGAALWLIAPLADHIIDGTQLGLTDLVAAISIVLSVALFFYIRFSKLDPRVILDMGLVYLVLIGLGAGLMYHWPEMKVHQTFGPEISWMGAGVIAYAALLPTKPYKMFVAGLIAVSMMPVTMLISGARHTWEFGPWWKVLEMHFPDFVLVGVAVVISKVVATLGQQVAKAREMGSYRLGDLLGFGGMGEVYRATHSMLARPAAIKLIRADTIRPGNDAAAELAIKRFRREAEVAASLRSPHTVELYDFGVTEDETLYFVMELLDGMTIDALVKQHGPLSADRAVFILCQVCDSLQEAHTRGLVHRDIKPANIHVGILGLHHDFVKVLDFGLVKSVEATLSDQSMGTAAGLTPGTPAYMAPEIVLGEHIDGRADIYAVGCVAYYMLTGEPVFTAENGAQMLARHLMAEPAPMSQRTTMPIPAELERLVFSCLEKKPDRRPQTVAELSSALATVAVTSWNEARALEWWQANRKVEPQ